MDIWPDWHLTDETQVAPIYQLLLKRIRLSNLPAIRFVALSAGNTGTSIHIVPQVAWSKEQTRTLSEAIFRQLPVLVRRAEAGEQMALEVLEEIESSRLHGGIVGAAIRDFCNLTDLRERIDRDILTRVCSLLTRAEDENDLLSLKAAFDMYRTHDESPITDPTAHSKLKRFNPKLLLERYRAARRNQGLPELIID